MCIGIWTLEHPEYALILGTNRDEFLHRPTQKAHFHSFGDLSCPDSPGQILSGRDEQAGGSWFGINRAGRVALLTNITETVRKYNTSRGYFVSSFLSSNSSHSLEDELEKIMPEDANFAGFNLLLLSPSVQSDGSLIYDPLFVTNHGGGGQLTSRKLSSNERFCSGMSNGIDGEGANLWPKLKHATEGFDAILQTLTQDVAETDLTDRLFQLLAWHPSHSIAHRSELRQTVCVNPVPLILEGSNMATPAYYGTRLTTLLLIKRDGEVLFIERDIWVLADGKPVKTDPPTERRFRFKLDIKPNGENH